jgi:hypothetical protein
MKKNKNIIQLEEEKIKSNEYNFSIKNTNKLFAEIYNKYKLNTLAIYKVSTKDIYKPENHYQIRFTKDYKKPVSEIFIERAQYYTTTDNPDFILIESLDKYFTTNDFVKYLKNINVKQKIKQF